MYSYDVLHGGDDLELPMDIALKGVDVFLLILVRMTGIFVISPIFGRRNVPTYMKIGFSMMLTIIMVNIIKTPDISEHQNLLQFIALIGKEFLVGITLGYVSYMIFSAIYLAGQLIDMMMGFGMVNVLDPMTNIQIPVTANFYFILSMLVFLAVNGHHHIIRALFQSFETVPIGSAVFGALLIDDVLRIFGDIFVIGFKIAAPIIATVLISDVALGVLSKAVPQLNVFVVGMPLKIVLGMAVIAITIPAFLTLLESLFDGMSRETMSFLKDLVPE